MNESVMLVSHLAIAWINHEECAIYSGIQWLMVISSENLSSTIKSPSLPSRLLLRPFLQTRPLFTPTTNFATMSHNRKNKNNVPEKGREVAISKGLSYILRHAAEREGLKMDAQGYANVADVVRTNKT